MTQEPAKINLGVGWPYPDLLGAEDMKQASVAIFHHPKLHQRGSPLGYGTDEGDEDLRVSIASWLTDFYEPPDPVVPENLCVTGGASQNLACILQVFTDPGYTRKIWMITPTYMCAARIFEDAGFAGRLMPVPEICGSIDIQSLDMALEASEATALESGNDEPRLKPQRPWRKVYKHIIYAVPTFSNPSGTVMGMASRLGLVSLARKYDALIVTDDVYDMVQWEQNAVDAVQYPVTACLPRIVDIDGSLGGGFADAWGHSVSNGSFSKLIGPGCRTGWAQGSTKLAYGISQVGSTRSGGAPSQFSGCLVQSFLKNSLSDFMNQTLLPAYARRHQILLAAINQHLVPLGVEVPSSGYAGRSGGFFVWINLPQHLQSSVVTVNALKEENLVVFGGEMFFVGPHAEALGRHSLRLSFSWEEESNLEQGVQRLARTVQRQLQVL